MGQKIYNELSGYYDLLYSNDYKKQADFLLNFSKKYFGEISNVKVLDLACGTGEHIRLLKDYLDIEGRDLNPGMIEISKNKNLNCFIGQIDLNNIELEKEKYNIIYCFSSSIQYIIDPNKIINVFYNLYKSLKPGGVLIFDLAYCKEKWIEPYVGVKTISKENLQVAEIFKSRSLNNISYHSPIYLIKNRDEFEFHIDNHEIYLYTIKEIKKSLKKSGFKKVFLKGDYKDEKFKKSKNKVPVFLAIR